MTASAGRVPPWLSRVLEPQAVADSRMELAWTLAWSALAASVVVAELLAGPRTIGAGALSILPVAAASWMLGRSQLAAVVALTLTLSVIATLAGALTPAELVARLLAVVAVAVVGRTAAISAAEVRSARRHEVSTLLHASHLLGRPLDQQAVAAEVVQVAAGVLAAPGTPGPLATALFHVDRGQAILAARHDGSGTASRPGTAVPLADLPAAFHETLASARPVVAAAGGLEPALPCPDGAAGWVMARVQVDAMPVGVLAVAPDAARTVGRDELRLLEGVAGVAGQALGAALHQTELDRLRQMLAEARQMGQAKSAFLNLAAHELRTPLAVIKGYLSLLEDGTYPVPDETRDEAVGTLLAKTQELESLVEALLTTARLEGGSLPLAPGLLDVGQAVQDAVARIRPRARLESARIDLRLPDGDLLTRADRAHVARILDNLLNNALTYSGRPARITVEVRPTDPIELAVRDHGLGIPPEHHQRIFERFHRVERSSSGYNPGLGLGLSISRELAQMNGGELVLEESVPGAGSVFVLRLPSPGEQQPAASRAG